MFLKAQKRMLSFLLALVLLLSVFMSVAVFPASAAGEENYGVTINGEDCGTFASLSAALSETDAVEGRVITVLQDVTYGTGVDNNLTIPSGTMLLVPFDSDHTVYRMKAGLANLSNPEPKIIGSYETPYSFCTMTMAPDSKLIVAEGGELCVNSQLSSVGSIKEQNNANGCPTGPGGRICMASDSEIVVDGGYLYAWGYIYRAGNNNEGTVTVNSGTVYEAFQITNYRGFNESLTAAGGENFPFNQYYVQNVEVPMTIKYGANEVGVAALNRDNSLIVPIDVAFIGETGLFVMADPDGYVVKDYIEATDRLNVEIHGDSLLSSLQLSLGSHNIDSSDFTLPITNNITVEAVEGNLAITQDISMLPGTQIKIDEDAKMTIAQDTSIYLCDADSWESNAYVDASADTNFIPVSYSAAANGAPTARDDDDIVNAQVDINGAVVVNGGFYCVEDSEADVISSNGTGTITYSTSANVYSTVNECQGNAEVSPVEYWCAGLRIYDESGEFYTYVEPITDNNEFIAGGGTFTEEDLDEYGFWNYTPILNKHSLSLDGDIVVNFYQQIPADYAGELEDYADVTADFSWGKTYTGTNSYNNTAKTVTGVTGTYAGNGFVKFSLPIAVKELNDEITATFKYNDTEIDGTQHTYKGTYYAYQLLGMSDMDITPLLNKEKDQTPAELRELARTMLIYSAAAQVNFGYNTGNLATYDLSDTAIDPVDPDALTTNSINELPSDVLYYGSSLNLGSQTSLDICLLNESGTEITDDSVQAYYYNSGSAVKVAVRNNGIAYVVRLADIPAAKVTESISVTLSGCNFTVNVGDYIKTVLTSRNANDPLYKTVTALYAYNQSAVAFFN